MRDNNNIQQKAASLAEQGVHPSVNIENLTSTNKNSSIFSLNSYLYHIPVIGYLDQHEQPHYIFYNLGKGVGVKQKDDLKKPDGSSDCLFIFTDERILILLGKKGESNEVIEITYESIYQAESNIGALKHRIRLKRPDSQDYQLWINNSFDKGDIEQAVGFINNNGSVQQKIKHYGGNLGETTNDTSEVTAPTSKDEIMEKIQTIDTYQFEELVADIWESNGWSTKVTQASADRGIDVIATRQKPFPQKQILQAKRYAGNNKVSSSEVQQYASLRQQEDRVDSVCVVTTSDFSKQAKELANELNVKLIDGDTLYEMLEQTGLVQEYFNNLEEHSEPTEQSASKPSEPLSSKVAGGNANENLSSFLSEYGTAKAHLWVAVLTFWWTFGIGNLIYAVYKKRNQS